MDVDHDDLEVEDVPRDGRGSLAKERKLTRSGDPCFVHLRERRGTVEGGSPVGVLLRG